MAFNAAGYIFKYRSKTQEEADRHFEQLYTNAQESQIEDFSDANELIAKIKSNLKGLGK